MKTGIELIAEERQEQIEKHGRTVEKDIIENDGGALMYGAIALMTNNSSLFSGRWDNSICENMIKKDYKERLIKAGALIAAEIDRMQFI